MQSSPGNKNRLDLFQSVSLFSRLFCPEMLIRNLHLVRLAHQRLLFSPGTFQLLHPVHFFHCILQSQVCLSQS